MPDHATASGSSQEGTLPPTPPRHPGARERGRMRRRLRGQTRMREALLVDLGALVYELHRHGRREPALLQAKAAELTAVDGEVRALADALDAGYDMLALVAAGIAGSCERCGSLLATDARYCSSCGASAVASLAGDATADGRDGHTSTVERSGSEPLEQQERDLDLSTDEIEAVPRAQPQADPAPEGERAPEPEAEAEKAPEAEPEVALEAEPEREREVAPEAEPEAEVVPEPERDRDREAVPEPEPEPEPEVVREPEAQFESAAEAEVAPEPEARPLAEPEPQAESVPQPQPAAPEPGPPETPAPTDPPLPLRRRRSGGAVGRVAGALKRARKG